MTGKGAKRRRFAAAFLAVAAAFASGATGCGSGARPPALSAEADSSAVADAELAADVPDADALPDQKQAVDASVEATVDEFDAADVALDVTTDAAAADVAADASDAAGSAQPTVTTIAVSTNVKLGPGHLVVILVNFTVPTCEPTPLDVKVFEGDVTLPAEVTALVPPGKWLPAAGWMTSAGTPQATSIDGNFSGVLTVGPGQSGPPKVEVTINTPAGSGTCEVKPDLTLLATQIAYIVPFSNVGVAHLLEGLAWNGHWWMAANVEGIGRVKLGDAGKSIADWKALPLADCRHLARLDNRLFCSDRGNHVAWMDIDPQTNDSTKTGTIELPAGTHAEGLTVGGTTLYVALHDAGVATVPLQPLGFATVHAFTAVKDAWHVAALDDQSVVVANGADGVVLLSPLKAGSMTVQATLPLPGLSAHLATHAQTVAVGALGGGLHLLSVKSPGDLTLLGTLPAGISPIVGVDIQDDLVYAAAGRALLAVPIPLQSSPLLHAVAAELTDKFTSLDVHAMGPTAVTAEYALVRQLLLNPPTASPPGPLCVGEQETWTGIVTVGQTATFTARIWNPGKLPLHLTNFQVKANPYAEVPSPGPVTYAPIADQTVQPGQTLAFPVLVTKKQAGQLNLVLGAFTDDPKHPVLQLGLSESPLALPGTPLPPLVYHDKNQLPHDVGKELAGSPGIVIVFAETCPVAFERMGALLQEIGPAVKAGQLKAVAINPWDTPEFKEIGGIKLPFPELFTPLTTKDNAAWSEVADGSLSLPGKGPIPPLPLVFLLDKAGKIVYANLGYAPVPFQDALQALLKP